MIFLTLIIDVQMFIPALLLEKVFRKPVYSTVFPPFLLIVSVLLLITFKEKFNTLISLLGSGIMVPTEHLGLANSMSITFIIINIFTSVIAIFMKRWYIAPIGFITISAFILDLFLMNNIQVAFTGIAMVIFAILLPLIIFLDFMKTNRHPIILQYNPDELLNEMPFGIIVPHERGVYFNSSIRKMLEDENVIPNEWFQSNIDKLKILENDYFIETNLEIAEQTFHFSIMKKVHKKYLKRTDVYILFNYTNIKVIEKMSKDYTNFVVTSLMDKIYQYNIQVQYNKMFEFLKGFAHNSFSMLSVIKAGFEYILDAIENIETNLYTAKSLNKAKEDIGSSLNTIQKTLALTNTGLVKLQEAFKILNNKIRYESIPDLTIFNINDLIEQELFFYVLNTQYKYTINIEKKLNENLRDIEFNYKILSSVFNNILLFIINELSTSHIKHILVKTFVLDDGSICIRIEGSTEDYDSRKIDEILSKSLYTDNEKYADLINAFLMVKSTGSILRRIDDKTLIFEIIINE